VSLAPLPFGGLASTASPGLIACLITSQQPGMSWCLSGYTPTLR
jgi:hypothetical protein